MNKRSIGIIRQLDPLGRIVIPKETRDLLGIHVEDPLEFFIDDQTIMLRKYRSTCCLFCQSDENLTMFRNQFVCKACIQEALGENGLIPMQDGVREAAPVRTETKPIKVKRRNQSELLKAIEQAVTADPSIKQKQLAEILGVTQGRISQLMKLCSFR